jgi:hypothetical protein
MGSDSSVDTKQIILTGEAAASLQSRKRRSRKNLKGGGSTQGAIIQLQSTTSSSDQPTASVEGINPAKIAQTSATVDAPTTIQQSGTQQSGGKPKVVLRASKKPTHKVVLSVSKIVAPVVHTQKAKTRKVSKKITFSLKNLRKKLTTAKTIKKHSEEKSLDEIKKLLVETKLIKPDSKAPETMLRHMYSDFMMLKHRAL